MGYPFETFVVSWAMRATKLLVLHTDTNYCDTNLIFFKKTQVMKNKHALLKIKEAKIAVYAVML
jgi:hypothetical protein